MFEILGWAIVAVILAIAFASLIAPSVVRYTETIDISAPIEQVFDNIRYQSRLMRWSAWPAETKSQCAVAGPDGEVGA